MICYQTGNSIYLNVPLFRFNGQAVPGSPFSCKVSPGNTQPRVPVSGSGIELAAVGVAAEIKIEGISGKITKYVYHHFFFFLISSHYTYTHCYKLKYFVVDTNVIKSKKNTF